jgi:flagellar operon protein
VNQDFSLRSVSLPIASQKGTVVGKTVSTGTNPKGITSFQAELNKHLQQPVSFSAHALERLRMRNICLTQDDLLRIGNAVDKVAAKGGRESLVVYNNTAYVISIKNRTVITAVDTARMQDHVFTQIDSAVFA